MSLLRNAIVRSVNGAQRPSHSPLRLTRLSAPLLPFNRTYASKNKKKDSRADNVTSDQKKGGKGGGITTDQLIPGSQRFVTSPEYISTEKKMKTAIDYYRKEVAALEMRASGRVTPAVLSPVRVMLPDHRGGDGKGVRLEEIATVGVREGTTLLITVFEEHVSVLEPLVVLCTYNEFSRPLSMWKRAYTTQRSPGLCLTGRISAQLRYRFPSEYATLFCMVIC